MDINNIRAALLEVVHPAKQNKSIVELGMVGDIEATDSKITVTLVFPGRRDPLAEYLIGAARAALIRNFPGIESEVKTVVAEDPKPAKKKLELTGDTIKHIGKVIGIASGKGGVGKSTVAVNLAVALARLGYKVGLADADVYGPSVPTMTATVGEQPAAYGEEGHELMVPIEKYGVKWMSIGYFAGEDQALIWRGPMACSALKQMILQVDWGELDYLLIDLPPGTGDIHISLVQDIRLDSAIIVTTPQKVAISDVRKGIGLFQNENVDRRILGIVENMAWFTPAEHPEEKYFIFGREGGAAMARELGLDLLAQIPLVQSVRESGDAGEPAALGTGPDAQAFLGLAAKVAEIA
ncbi:MAG: Mrp/NBP35 family ATP-binding protein [Bacteroidales bacterium]|nr:Mrp/NBP35 family ATP-binding protein [Bacteroidales bacterium]